MRSYVYLSFQRSRDLHTYGACDIAYRCRLAHVHTQENTFHALTPVTMQGFLLNA